MRPGVSVSVVDTPAPRSAPTTTDVAFMVGLSDEGPLGPDLVTGLADFRRRYGARIAYGLLYDAAEAFFREGGSRAYLSRVVGPAAVNASRVLNDGAAAASLRVSAMSPGPWGNDLTVAVAVVTGGYQITVARDGSTLDQSPVLADKGAALDWGVLSPWVDVTVAGGGGNPAALAATALAGGVDDHAGVTDDEWIDALDRFGRNLGPGQVLAPGVTSAAVQGALLDHAAAYNRAALLDAPNTAVVASLTTAAATARGAAPGNARLGALWAPWVRLPGIAGATTRTVPPSPVIAGLIARSDAAGNSPGLPAANLNGLTRSVQSLVAEFSEDDLSTLYAAGVNLIRDTFNGTVAYGDTSLANRNAEPAWGGFAANRVVMTVAARAGAILDRYVFDVIDGRGRLFQSVAADLLTMLGSLWSDGSLYGDTFNEAARVDLGPAVNTPETIANRELHAAIAIRTSPAAEMVTVEIARSAITEELV